MENLLAVLEAENLLAEDEKLRQGLGDGRAGKAAAIGRKTTEAGRAGNAKSGGGVRSNTRAGWRGLGGRDNEEQQEHRSQPSRGEHARCSSGRKKEMSKGADGLLQ